MNDTDQIIKDIEDCLHKLDDITLKWGKSRADHEYRKEYKKVVLNLEKTKSDKKSNADRETEAYASESYKKYLWSAFTVDCEYFSLDGQKSLLERRLDSLRSLLSFNKNQINRTM